MLVPPDAVADPATVYVADYGRHASLIVPRDGGYTEYAFGEWEWFARGKARLLRGPLVLIVPGQATLGRRDLGGIVSAEEACSRLDGAAAQAIVVEREKARALVAELDRRFEAAVATRVTGPDGMQFVKDPSPYYALHNSNRVTAEWLEKLGVGVRGPAVFSRFEIATKPRATRGGS